MKLSILCQTRAEPHAWSFLASMRNLANRAGGELVVAADGAEAFNRVLQSGVATKLAQIRLAERGVEWVGRGMLNMAFAACDGAYVLRLDDDERCSAELDQWLVDGAYDSEELWRFARVWLWGDQQHYLTHAPFWPDWQIRLALKETAVVPHTIHAGCFDGVGIPGPGAIEHHKFLVRSRTEREVLVAFYDGVQSGAGLPEFYLPEDRPMKVGVWY